MQRHVFHFFRNYGNNISPKSTRWWMTFKKTFRQIATKWVKQRRRLFLEATQHSSIWKPKVKHLDLEMSGELQKKRVKKTMQSTLQKSQQLDLKMSWDLVSKYLPQQLQNGMHLDLKMSWGLVIQKRIEYFFLKRRI